MKAMLLAAGFGKRLQPFTLTTPKPLLPIPQGGTLIDRHLTRLAAAGVTDVLINLAHLGDQIKQHVGNGSHYGIRVTYSQEVPSQPLETGGAVQAALPWFSDESFLLLAADIWTDYPWQNLMASSTWALDTECAHLVLIPTPDWCSQPDFCLDTSSPILMPRTVDKPGYGYAGFGVFTPAMWEGFAPGVFPLTQVITRCLENAAQSITGSVYRGPWFNIGDRDRLRELELFCQTQG